MKSRKGRDRGEGGPRDQHHHIAQTIGSHGWRLRPRSITTESIRGRELQAMDSARFDSLVPTLTVAGSRRRALAATLGGSLGPLDLTYSIAPLGSLLTGEARGKSKKRNNR